MAREYSIGVAFRLPISVVEMVDELAEKNATNRSQTLLQIVKEHFGGVILRAAREYGGDGKGGNTGKG